jgi:hypothetical protein
LRLVFSSLGAQGVDRFAVESSLGKPKQHWFLFEADSGALQDSGNDGIAECGDFGCGCSTAVRDSQNVLG